MIAPTYLRAIIRMSLSPIGLWSQEAEELLLMTAAHESSMGKYTKQIKGTALGLYQMEPETLYDNYVNYLHYRPNLFQKIADITGATGADLGQLEFNPLYSTIHARIKYRRSPVPLPPASDTRLLAEYAKNHYNTHLGKATPENYNDAYRRLILA